MIALGAPGNPGRPPNSIRSPDPAATIMQLPAAIMKRGPAPGIIRLPEPSGIGINPMAAITVGPPSSIDDHRARLPAPAESFQFHPRTVGREIVVKIVHLDGRRGGGIGGGRSDGGLRRDF